MISATSGNEASVASVVITGATFCLTFGVQAIYKYSDTDGKDDLKTANLELDLAFDMLEKLRNDIQRLTREHGKTWLFQKVLNLFKSRVIDVKESCIETRNFIESVSLRAIDKRVRLEHGIPEGFRDEQNPWSPQCLQARLSTIPEAAAEPNILDKDDALLSFYVQRPGISIPLLQYWLRLQLLPHNLSTELLP
ncbi:hypothetical protein H0H87_004628 [Tephrocybe sp. NHM501043]|nr:hypothetical protein H0H87_004628 [Tephrocybe sp. NHM501043]